MAAEELTVVQVLRASAELLSDPAHWTQGISARDKFGIPVYAWDPNACKWCMSSVPFKFAPRMVAQKARRYIKMALPSTGYHTVHHWNDVKGRLHSEVVTAMWRAVDIAETEETNGHT